MPSDIYVKKNTGWSTAVKSIKARTNSGWSSAIRYVYAFINSGWTRVWPLSGIYATTNPWISTTTSSTELSSTTVLRVGNTYRGNRGTFNPNGYTISSYQYKWVSYASSDITNSTMNYSPTMTTLSGTTNDFTITGTNYDKGYIAFFVTAKASGGTAYDGSADSLRYYVVRQKPINLTASLSTNSPSEGNSISFSSSWNTTDAYLPEQNRTTIKWYYSSSSNGSSRTEITRASGLYTWTIQSSDGLSGQYIIAEETCFNSGSDYELGATVGVSKTLVTTSTVTGAPIAGTPTLSTDTGNFSAGSVITVNAGTGWSNTNSYSYKLYVATSTPVPVPSTTKTLTGTNSNQYTITNNDANNPSYYFRGEVTGYSNSNQTGSSATATTTTSNISYINPSTSLVVSTPTSTGFTITGAATQIGYVSVSAIYIYDVNKSLISTITTGLPSVGATDGIWQYVWTGGSGSTTYYAKAQVKSSDTNGTTYTTGFSSSIQTAAPNPNSFSFSVSDSGTVTTPPTPTITRVSNTSNTVLFNIDSSKPSDTYQYGVNQSGAAFGSRTGTPAQYVTTLNQWDANGNNNPGIYDTISTIEPGSNNSAMTISTTAYGSTRSANANVSTTTGASSWAINFSWSGAATGSVTYYSNGVGTASSSASGTVTVYTNSMPIKIIDVTGSSDATITINNVTAYSGSNQTGSTTAGTAGAPASTSKVIVRSTATSGSTTQNYTYYITYTITYYGNGNTGGSTAATTSTLPITVASNGFTKTGNTFNGWNTASDGSGTNYAEGSSYNTAANLSLYAKWTVNTYTVSYDANGGTGAPSSQTKTYGVNLTLSSTTPTRSGYTFANWNTVSNGTGTSYSSGGTYSTDSAVTLYAQWNQILTPSIPTSLSATTNRTDGVNLTFSGSTNATSYDIFWNTTASAYPTASSTPDFPGVSSPYLDTGIASGGIRYYWVRGKNSNGTSDWYPYNTNGIYGSRTAATLKPPNNPTGLTTPSSGTSPNLVFNSSSWTAPATDSTHNAATYYQVYFEASTSQTGTYYAATNTFQYNYYPSSPLTTATNANTAATAVAVYATSVASGKINDSTRAYSWVKMWVRAANADGFSSWVSQTG